MCTHIENFGSQIKSARTCNNRSLTFSLTFYSILPLLRDPSLANHLQAAGRSQLPAYFFKRPNRGELILRLLRSSRAYTPLPNRFPTNAAQWPEKRYIARDPNRFFIQCEFLTSYFVDFSSSTMTRTTKVRKQGRSWTFLLPSLRSLLRLLPLIILAHFLHSRQRRRIINQAWRACVSDLIIGWNSRRMYARRDIAIEDTRQMDVDMKISILVDGKFCSPLVKIFYLVKKKKGRFNF